MGDGSMGVGENNARSLRPFAVRVPNICWRLASHLRTYYYLFLEKPSASENLWLIGSFEIARSVDFFLKRTILS